MSNDSCARRRTLPYRPLVVVLSVIALALGGCASMPTAVENYRSQLKAEEIDGLSMSYRDEGPKDGPAVVLLHGIPTSSFLFRDVIGPLSDKGYRVIAPDLIGYGASDKPDAGDEHAFDKQAVRVRELLKRLGISKFSVVVHDLGGLVGFEILVQAPTAVEGIVVLNTTAYEGFTPPEEMEMMAGPMGPMMASMMGGSMMGPGLTGDFIRANMAKPDSLTEAQRDNYWWPMHEGTTEGMLFVARRFGTLIDRFPTYQKSFRNFEGPARVLWGAQDPVLSSTEIAPKFAADLHAPLTILEDSSHFVPEDRPDAVIKEILTMLAEVQSRKNATLTSSLNDGALDDAALDRN